MTTSYQEENGTWVYYDRDGSQVTDKWEKSGNSWFYLNGDGEMATDELIEDRANYFYVDSDGSMATNKWVAIENGNAGDEDEPEANWYYFQANGKAYKSTGSASFKTINGKSYAFDSEAKMFYGWINKEDATRITGDSVWETGDYYCGDESDGARTTGWAKLDVNKDDEDKSYWFYFNTANGKKTTPEDGKEFVIKTINGKKYAFDEKDVMQNKWSDTVASHGDSATISEYSYYNGSDEGHRLQNGWAKVVPEKNVNETAHNDDSTKWFYADGSGNMYHSALKTINGKKYAFNRKDEMLSGLWVLNVDLTGLILGQMIEIDNESKFNEIPTISGEATYATYYFGDGDDGSAKTGNQTVTIDGDTYSYVFGTTGYKKYKGEGDIDKTLLVYGRKIKSDKDYRYQEFDLNGKHIYGASSVGVGYLVNTSGSIMKNKTNLKDTDGFYYSTGADGKVTYYGREAQSKK